MRERPEKEVWDDIDERSLNFSATTLVFDKKTGTLSQSALQSIL